ncbi:YdaS family helix-turn-helix protein [Methylophilus flavus]|uniref:YdaS family helix-turn-helix protein n=1 Tax=Methylophilus flavus TaxID=640084 RepID=A0ABW3PA97_9PROT
MKHDLNQFLKSLGSKPEKEDFASRCNTTFKHLLNIAYGYKPAGESLCINIERETSGKVRCESLRSDVDWSVLRNS